MSRMDTAPATSSHDAPGQGARQTYVAERQRNPFVRSARGGRLLSALQLPWFTLLPPAGYGVLTTIGRRTGRQRRKCVRAIRRGDVAFVVAIRPTAWLKNLRANPEVTLRIRGGTFSAVAREPRDAAEVAQARAAYCETVHPVDFLACSMHRTGLPSPARIRELQRTWFAKGTPIVLQLR